MKTAGQDTKAEGSWPAQDVMLPLSGWLAWRFKERKLSFAGELPRAAKTERRDNSLPGSAPAKHRLRSLNRQAN